MKIVEFYFDKFYSKKAKSFEKIFLFWKFEYHGRTQYVMGFFNRFCLIQIVFDVIKVYIVDSILI